jgi:hypothetical protein
MPNVRAVWRNMTVSREEALDLLRKWSSESAPIIGYSDLDGLAFRLSGVIAQVFPHGFVIARYTNAEKTTMCADLTVVLVDASNYEYLDSANATDADEENFTRILKTAPKAFVALLEKKQLLPP